jgi:hypothetical protein
VRENEQNHSPVEGKRPVVFRPHFKTYRSLERTKVSSWVPTGPDTKNDCGGEGQQQFVELDWTGSSELQASSGSSWLAEGSLRC